MKLTKTNTRKRLAALSVCLLQLSVFIPVTGSDQAALAAGTNKSKASGNIGTIGAMQRLDDFEEVIYGEPRHYLTTDARLKELETKLFGETQTGTYEVRLSKIAQALSFGSQSKAGLNSLAPSLDSASAATRADKNSDLPNYQVDSSAALEEAMKLYSEGRIDEAESAFHSIIARDPKNADAYFNLGVIQESHNDLAGALSSYRRAQSLNSKEPDYASAVSALELKLGPSFGGRAAPSATAAKATAPPQTAQKAPAAKPASAADKKIVEQATANFKQGQYDSAIEKLKGVAARNPHDADVQYAIGQAYKAKGDMIGAMSYLARASSLAPGNQMYSEALESARASLQSPGGNFTPPPVQAPSSVASEGQIKPFSGSKASEATLMGKASASSSRRIKRAITYGMAGAATSVLASTLLSRGGRGKVSMKRMRNAAIGGAVAGGLMGLVLGK